MSRPEPGLHSKAVKGRDGAEVGPQHEREGGQVIGVAGAPDMVQGHNGATAAYLATGELAMPGEANGESGSNVFPEELAQTNGDVDFPD